MHLLAKRSHRKKTFFLKNTSKFPALNQLIRIRKILVTQMVKNLPVMWETLV